MKAILEFEAPEDCEHCILAYDGYLYCYISGELATENSRRDDCPLRIEDD